MFLEAGPQIFRLRETRSLARRHGDVHRGQALLVQPKRFPREPLDAIARHGGTEGPGCDRQTQSRMILLIAQNRQAEIRVAESLAALSHGTEFGRLVQTLARLERQPRD